MEGKREARKNEEIKEKSTVFDFHFKILNHLINHFAT